MQFQWRPGDIQGVREALRNNVGEWAETPSCMAFQAISRAGAPTTV